MNYEKEEGMKEHDTFVENNKNLVCKFLPDTTLTFVNKEFCYYFNKKNENLIGTKLFELLPLKDHCILMEKLNSFNIDNSIISFEQYETNSDSKTLWMIWNVQAFFDKNDNIIEFQSVGINTSRLLKVQEYDNEIERKVRERTKKFEKVNNKLLKEIKERIFLENELRKSSKRYQEVVRLTPNGVVTHNKGNIIFANDAFIKLVGAKSFEELSGRNLIDFMHPEYHEMARDHVKQLNDNKIIDFVEQKLISLDGRIIDIEATGMNLSFEEEPEILVIVRDISERKKSEKRIKDMAYHDALTNLPNRYFFNDYMKKILSNANNEQKIAVIFIDLDRFKIINDTMGHAFGDILLKEVSKRLIKCVRKQDVVCRYGGDEFIILMNDIDESKVIKVAKRIIKEFNSPFLIGNQEIFTSPSIGISLYPTDGDDVESIVKNADMAMYHAKEKGRNNFKFYKSNLSQDIYRKMDLENGLRKALDNNEFTIHYQPKFNLGTGKILGMEALIRWKHPKYGLIPPNEFIPLAEETGLIIDIGKWVLKTACKQNKIWQEAGLPSIDIAVNISARQFQQSNFLNIIKEVLEETKLNPVHLQLEITESIMQNIDELNLILNELKKIGIQVSVDDFGTGYSSLSILQQLSIDTLKIDKSFVNDITVGLNTSPIVKTIIDMGNNLGLNVIAEGIENEEQINFLKQNKCFIGQGYFFSKPLPADEIEKIFKVNR